MGVAAGVWLGREAAEGIAPERGTMIRSKAVSRVRLIQAARQEAPPVCRRLRLTDGVGFPLAEVLVADVLAGTYDLAECKAKLILQRAAVAEEIAPVLYEAGCGPS